MRDMLSNNKITSIEEFMPEVRKRISFLKEGDEIWIVTSDGRLLKKTVVEKIVKSYAYAEGVKYWVRGIDGKHRNRNNYMQFAMTPKDAMDYITFY